MKFTCTCSVLLSAIRNLLSLTSTRSTLPILANALLEATPTGLKVLGTDLETGFQGMYGATVETPGRITVHTRALYEVLKELDPRNPISCHTDEKHTVTIHSGKSRFTLHGLAADDYLQLPAFDQALQYRIASTDLLACLQQVLPAVPDTNQRLVLQSVLIRLSKSKTPTLTVVGTDGHRLAISESTAGTWLGAKPQSLEALIPKKAAQLLANLLAREDIIDVPIALSDKLLCVTV